MAEVVAANFALERAKSLILTTYSPFWAYLICATGSARVVRRALD
jgi:hypothetical protein